MWKRWGSEDRGKLTIPQFNKTASFRRKPESSDFWKPDQVRHDNTILRLLKFLRILPQGKKLFYTATLTWLLLVLISCGIGPAATAYGEEHPQVELISSSSIEPAVTIYYEGYAQVELISSKGRRVLIDVYDPKKLSSQATAEDILLTSHAHDDHFNRDFLSSFQGKQLFVQSGNIKKDDIVIQSMASAHNEGDPFKPIRGTNYIFIVDMDGLRIAHFGDIGQESLTTEQLTKLGKVDLAITQFDNGFSDMDTENKKGFNLMAQVKPRLIIPTHSSISAAKYAMTLWPCLYSKKPVVKIRRGKLTTKTRMLFIGEMAPHYAELIKKATAVSW